MATKTTKPKTSKPKPITVALDETPVEVIADVEAVLDPVDHVLLELHEREDGWWGGRVTFVDGHSLSMHAPHSGGVESSAYRVINAKAPTAPLVIKVV